MRFFKLIYRPVDVHEVDTQVHAWLTAGDLSSVIRQVTRGSMFTRTINQLEYELIGIVED